MGSDCVPICIGWMLSTRSCWRLDYAESSIGRKQRHDTSLYSIAKDEVLLTLILMEMAQMVDPIWLVNLVVHLTLQSMWAHFELAYGDAKSVHLMMELCNGVKQWVYCLRWWSAQHRWSSLEITCLEGLSKWLLQTTCKYYLWCSCSSTYLLARCNKGISKWRKSIHLNSNRW